MEGAQFPISAADSLIEGYCDDFISLASILSQTLEQVSMRAIDISNSTSHLSRIESGMRELSEAIRDLIERGRVMKPGSGALNRLLESEPSVLQTAACADWLSTDPTDPDPEPEAEAEPHADSTSEYGLREQLDKDLGLDLAKQAAATAPSIVTDAVNSDAADTNDDSSDNRAEAPADGPSCLRGNNHGMPIVSVVQFVERMHKTGTLTVNLSDETMTFEFDRGFMRGCQTTNPAPGDRLGDLLVERANCDRDRLNAIIANTNGRSSTQIGEVLVRAGLATNTQIREALEHQAHCRFDRACKAEDGDYEFVESPPKPTDGRVHIALSELVPTAVP